MGNTWNQRVEGISSRRTNIDFSRQDSRKVIGGRDERRLEKERLV